MGLDMYLEGRKYIKYRRGQKRPQEDGYELVERTLRLGYWRKHPNLHGYIVSTFAEKDDCNPISLDETQLQQIIHAIERNQLPHTEGFFFGTSDGSEKEDDVRVFRAALDWLHANDDECWRSVEYRASW